MNLLLPALALAIPLLAAVTSVLWLLYVVVHAWIEERRPRPRR